MSRVHASIRMVIEHSDRIDLDDFKRYLEILLSRKECGSGSTWAMVKDYVSKAIDSINDEIEVEPVACDRPYRERLELHRAIDRVAA